MTRRNLTRGTKFSLRFCRFPDGRIVYGPVWAEKIAKAYNAAIKRAVKEAFRAGREYQEVENEAASYQAKIDIETKYGVKL